MQPSFSVGDAVRFVHSDGKEYNALVIKVIPITGVIGLAFLDEDSPSGVQHYFLHGEPPEGVEIIRKA